MNTGEISDQSSVSSFCSPTISPSPTGQNDSLPTLSNELPAKPEYNSTLHDQYKVHIRRARKKITEKERRVEVQQRFEDLKKLIPGLNVENRKAVHRQTILKCAVEYIEQLKMECHMTSQYTDAELRAEEEKNSRLEAEHMMWLEKLNKLREQKCQQLQQKHMQQMVTGFGDNLSSNSTAMHIPHHVYPNQVASGIQVL
ncbi:uncharacterized protein LOC117116259 [Anneissia japonica]|uniref:uncharacterized protein LOC117116259 n=1 Tax=Anneissia japonica TaxID=1529436 RepID=UPI00142596C0|nr:uncharacterized protein LOC117116259 [Anneissia japonica]